MKALILAAGYATRLYPLTKDFPKPLLEAGGQTILDHLMGQLETIPALDHVFLITNHRFLPHFEAWRRRWVGTRKITLIDDGTTSNEDRLGAIGDLQFAVRQARIDDDLLVTAADNILEFPLMELASAFRACPTSHLCVHVVSDTERLRRTGVVVLDERNRVLEFAEKPREPKTQLAVPPIYLFPQRTLPRVSEYLAQGGSAEAPGHFIEWLFQREPVYAHRIQGTILDIGTPQSLEAARQRYAGPSD